MASRRHFHKHPSPPPPSSEWPEYRAVADAFERRPDYPPPAGPTASPHGRSRVADRRPPVTLGHRPGLEPTLRSAGRRAACRPGDPLHRLGELLAVAVETAGPGRRVAVLGPGIRSDSAGRCSAPPHVGCVTGAGRRPTLLAACVALVRRRWRGSPGLGQRHHRATMAGPSVVVYVTASSPSAAARLAARRPLGRFAALVDGAEPARRPSSADPVLRGSRSRRSQRGPRTVRRRPRRLVTPAPPQGGDRRSNPPGGGGSAVARHRPPTRSVPPASLPSAPRHALRCVPVAEPAGPPTTRSPRCLRGHRPAPADPRRCGLVQTRGVVPRGPTGPGSPEYLFGVPEPKDAEGPGARDPDGVLHGGAAWRLVDHVTVVLIAPLPDECRPATWACDHRRGRNDATSPSPEGRSGRCRCDVRDVGHHGRRGPRQAGADGRARARSLTMGRSRSRPLRTRPEDESTRSDHRRASQGLPHGLVGVADLGDGGPAATWRARPAAVDLQLLLVVAGLPVEVDERDGRPPWSPGA